MKVHSLTGRRQIRVVLLVGSTVGWVAVALGVVVERGPVIAAGAVLAGTANVITLKLAAETRSAVDALAASSRSFASQVDRRHRSTTSQLDRHTAERKADLERIERRLGAAHDDAVKREATQQARLRQADDATRTRLEALEQTHGTTVDALAFTRSLVDKVAARVPSAVSTERLAALDRHNVENPLLSIAIPSFNRPDFLAECLASLEREILGSVDDTVEVCILDDASPDPDTLVVAVDFGERCDFASVRRQRENVGLERNLIAACQHCIGEYILVLGDDDVMIPGAVATMLSDLRTEAAPVHLYEKSRITVEGLPRDPVAGSSPIDVPRGGCHRFGSVFEAARRQGFLSTFGFISQIVFRREPFVAIDPIPYLDLTMYPQVFALIEAFGEQPVLYRNEAIVYHRTPLQTHRYVEALGRREAIFMSGGTGRRARYFGTTLAASWQRLIDRLGLDAAFLVEQPENLMTRQPLVEWIVGNRALDETMDGTLDPVIVAAADRFMAAVTDQRDERGRSGHPGATVTPSRMHHDARVICIAGMHCSGTSATARIVNLLGVDLGPPDVGEETYRTNTKGLWEHRGLRQVAQDVLSTLGGRWDDPPQLEPGWHTSSALEVHRAAASDIVESDFGTSSLWGWKDPRSSLLMPFWESVLGPMHVIICIRDPNDVAASLGRWDAMDRDRALALWMRYNLDVEAMIGQRPTIVSSYEALFEGGDAFARLAKFVGRAGADATTMFQDSAADWLDSSMWNSRAGVDVTSAVEGLPADVRSLYERLLASSST